MQNITPFLTAALSLFAVWIGARLTENRTYREKAWDRKASAYSEILESLGVMRNFLDESFDDIILHRDRSDEHNNKRSEEYRISKDKLMRTISRESWVLSDFVGHQINDLEKALSKRYDSYEDDLDATSFACRNAMEKIQNYARSDLVERQPLMLSSIKRLFSRKTDRF